MAKQNKKLNFRALLLILMAIVMVAGVVSCKKRNQIPMGDFTQLSEGDTGFVDEDGNTITVTNYITNYVTNTKYTTIFITNREYHPDKIIYVTNTITVTNSNLGNIYITNEYVYIDKVITNKIEVITNVTPDPKYYVSRFHNSMMYKVYAPFSGIGAEGEWKYTNVSYLDTDTLSALWKNMMKMKSYSGSRQELVIRNRGTGTYFYFDDNVNIRWSKRPDVILKKFVQGIIIRHICGNDTKGHYAIAGLYKLTIHSLELRKWNDTGVNILQGELFRWTRYAGEYDIIVLNPGHVVNGSEYGFEIYNTSGYDEFRYSQGGNGYYEQRPEVYMPKITHVTEAWKNYRPWELHDMSFKIMKR